MAATPPDHPNRAAYLVNLSSHLRTRFEHTAAAVDMDQAIRFAQEAAAVATAPASVRVTAARLWGRVAARGGHSAKAADGYAAAVGLLARVAPRSLGRSDQEYWLSELAGLGTQAAACCLQAGQVDRAVELWEQGRGVLLGQALDTRTDLTQLVEEHPQLAAELIRVRDELDPVEGSATTAATAPADRGHCRAAKKRRYAVRLTGGGNSPTSSTAMSTSAHCRVSTGSCCRCRWAICLPRPIRGPSCCSTSATSLRRRRSHPCRGSGGAVAGADSALRC